MCQKSREDNSERTWILGDLKRTILATNCTGGFEERKNLPQHHRKRIDKKKIDEVVYRI